jgi:sterol desaturase/sphingolipid hydroxylase (fatty acid hydroxylase superfamily)
MHAHLISVASNSAHMAVWLAIVSAIFIPIERLFALRPQRVFRKEIGIDFCYYFINGIIPGLVLGAPMAVVVLVSHELIPAAALVAIADTPMWARAVAAMVVGETAYYWAHRLSHEIPFLWRFHAIHHSAEAIDFMVSSRAHPIDFIWSRLVMLTPLFALGLVSPMRIGDGIIPAIVLIAGSLWGFFVHANVRWRFGPFEWLLATPGFHHWHHTMGLQRNCNYASIFPWLDRIFGSHYLPNFWPPKYGIPERAAPTLAGQLVQPFNEQRAILPAGHAQTTTRGSPPCDVSKQQSAFAI